MSKRNISKELRRVFSSWPLPILIALILLTAAVVISPGSLIARRAYSVFRLGAEEEMAMSAVVDAAGMYGEFECSCCGKNIGECDCGMAKERRAYLEGLATAGLGKRGIYKAMVKKYTADILFNGALAAEVKDELLAEAPADRPILEIDPDRVNAGEVSMADGKVEKVFQVRNVGRSVLEITGLESSCMCTTALLRYNGVDSPVFGMHDNPTDWSQALRPGESAELVVIFDPNAHGPEAVGPVMRVVTIYSNDIIDVAKKVRFEAVVVK